MNTWKRVRDSITGRFVTRADAKARPESTVEETATSSGHMETWIRETLPDLNEPFRTQEQAAIVELARAVDSLVLTMQILTDNVLAERRRLNPPEIPL